MLRSVSRTDGADAKKGRRVKVAIGAAGVVVALGAYAALDIYDVVPGVLTLDSARPQPVPELGQDAPPKNPVSAPNLQPVPAAPAQLDGPQVVPAKVAATLAKPLTNSALPSSVSMVVRDGRTGAVVFDKDSAKVMTPASVTKLVTAWAIAHTTDLGQTFKTRVVDGADGHITLVAGGDMMLGDDKGDPTAVPGRAGLGDLADQVARALKAGGRHTATLDVDLNHAPGPTQLPTWGNDLLDLGFTTRITMLGLASERSDPGTPAAQNPVRDVTTRLAELLRKRGIEVTLGDKVTAGAGARQLGQVQSAPLVDVLGQAMLDSDNALTENLARQAAYAHGVSGDETAVTAWVTKQLRAGGFDVAGLHLVDASGLSAGTTMTTRLLGELLARATTGKDPAYARVVARLGVGGLSGTVDERFLGKDTSAVAGFVRAKTGSLPQVSSLAGTLVDKDGRVLDFAIITNGELPSGAVGARGAIDEVVAALGGCGCR